MKEAGWTTVPGLCDIYPAWLIWMECTMRAKKDESAWFTLGWVQNMPEIVIEITEDAIICEREVMEEMKVWCMEMDEDTFKHGSVVEIFLWAYALHMSVGAGGVGEEPWCVQAVNTTCRWLCQAALQMEPNILENRRPVSNCLDKYLVEDEQQTTRADETPDHIMSGMSVDDAAATEVIKATRRKKPASQVQEPSLVITQQPSSKAQATVDAELQPKTKRRPHIKAPPGPKSPPKKTNSRRKPPSHASTGSPRVTRAAMKNQVGLADVPEEEMAGTIV
ncbi:hypothetical protein M422DRAFT_269003 [Sphaerobolus stellatus SS14]|uniref:Uncharacterized protein n=1 Tax=Sphaerobolus stellatus (strain SS14) TaxID=990650 RepID=A0A0C9UL73_SPHS4|nr:hypothetical protein M422DRAFT_269003 [Sphaerobolus stellatus SS14]